VQDIFFLGITIEGFDLLKLPNINCDRIISWQGKRKEEEDIFIGVGGKGGEIGELWVYKYLSFHAPSIFYMISIDGRTKKNNVVCLMTQRNLHGRMMRISKRDKGSNVVAPPHPPSSLCFFTRFLYPMNDTKLTQRFPML
jgi:hypothetical protein